MLENLDKLDWQNLQHAYGEASDVPDLIRALASSNENARNNAMYELYGNIWHQGTVYEATSYAVPFLIELLECDEVQGKDEILELLCDLANGHTYKAVHQTLEAHFFGEEEVNSPQYQAEMQVEVFWVKQAHGAVAEGMPVYFKLLKHPDPEVRLCAPYTLACLSERAAEILPIVEACLESESNPQVRASLLFCIGTFTAGYPQQYSQLFKDIVKEEKEHALVKLAAAMQMVMLTPDTPSPEAVQRLIEAMTNPEEVEEAYNALPWNDAGVVADTSIVLCNLGPEAVSIVLPPCLEALKKSNPFSALSLSTALLNFAFDHRPLPKDQDLTDTQKSVLQALVECDQSWQINVNMAEILETFALPESRKQLHAFVAEKEFKGSA